MPIDIESLLQPISAEAPAGADLRYSPITEQIKEARRQEDGLSQGVWQREVKVADYLQVIKLSRETLTKRSKDLQVAGWLAEALLRQEGFAGLRQGLDLIYRLLETFWESVYPQKDDDGDLELRATPLMWVGSQLDSAVRSVPLTKAGHNWYEYKESRTVPTEDEAGSDSAKQERRAEAIADGKMPPEEFDKGVDSTPAVFCEKLHDELGELVEFVRTLSGMCDEKFGDAAPDFSPLRTSLEDVYQTTRLILKKKGGPAEAAAPAGEEEGLIEEEIPRGETGDGEPAVRRPARRRVSAGGEPADFEDAVERLLAAARFMRRENPQSPAPYLIPRALRWGELRATGGSPEPMTLEAPSTEIRMELKRLAVEGAWDQALEAAENAAGLPCGRAWLDLQRYAVTACRNTGNDTAAAAILSELKALLADIPALPQWVLADDTPAANAETLQWLKDENVLPGAEPVAPEPQPAMEWYPPPERTPARDEGENAEPAPPDAFELAMDAVRSGRVEEAIGILSREAAQERSGRDRFLRRIQLAQICLASGNDAVARPVLQELADEIEQRNLEAWEVADVVAQPLALLYGCLDNSEDGAVAAVDKRKLYARICRLDPRRALGLPR
jgi:type VI secretion system protein ImpA